MDFHLARRGRRDREASEAEEEGWSHFKAVEKDSGSHHVLTCCGL